MSYSIALHMLILISQSPIPLSSAKIALSTGANASQIRKIAGLLRRSGLVKTRKGAAGIQISRDIADITLLEVYQAVYECEKVHLLTIHRNPNDKCVVGKYIRPVLTDVFGVAEASAARTMDETTVADLVAQMRAVADSAEVASATGEGE